MDNDNTKFVLPVMTARSLSDTLSGLAKNFKCKISDFVNAREYKGEVISEKHPGVSIDHDEFTGILKIYFDGVLSRRHYGVFSRVAAEDIVIDFESEIYDN